MADLIDLFTGSTTLDAHTSDSGNTWGRFNSGQAANLLQVLGGQAYDNATGAGGKEYVSNYVNASADSRIRVVVNVGTITGNPEIGLWGRCTNPNSTANKGYMGRYAYGAGYQFFSLSNSNYTQLGSTVSASGPANGDTLGFTISGSSPVVLSLYKNGSLVATVNDAGNFLTAAGSPGIHVYNPGGVEANNYRVDTVWAGALAGPALSVTPVSNTLTAGGPTTIVTASGFTGQTTTPSIGPVFISSAPSVATVDSVTGVVTPVAVGTCTITATGSIINLETATSAVITVNAAAAATTTSLSLGSSSGYAGVPVNLIVGSNGTYAGTKACTFSDNGAGGTFSGFAPITQTPATGIATYTPPPGITTTTVTITATLTGLGSASQNYTANANILTISQSVLPTNATTTVTFSNPAGLYVTAPTITTALTGVTVGTVTRVNNTTATAPVTVGSIPGSGTFTDNSDGATAAYTTAAVSPYLSSVTGFAPGLASVGYSIYTSTNSIYSARSSTGVAERSPGTYAALVSLPLGASYEIRWDNGFSAPTYASDFVTISSATAGGGSGIVTGYATGQDPATLLLINPNNRLQTDPAGRINVGKFYDAGVAIAGGYPSVNAVSFTGSAAAAIPNASQIRAEMDANSTKLANITGSVALASQIPANFTTSLFASSGVFSVGSLANAPAGGGGGVSLTAIQAELNSRGLTSSFTSTVALASQIPVNFTPATFASAGVLSIGALSNGPAGGGGGGGISLSAIQGELDTRGLTTATTAAITTNLDAKISTRLATSGYTNPPATSAIAAAILATPGRPIATDASGSVSMSMSQSIPLANPVQTVGDALNAARAQGFGQWTLDPIARTLKLFGPDGSTVVRTFALDSVTATTART